MSLSKNSTPLSGDVPARSAQAEADFAPPGTTALPTNLEIAAEEIEHRRKAAQAHGGHSGAQRVRRLRIDARHPQVEAAEPRIGQQGFEKIALRFFLRIHPVIGG